MFKPIADRLFEQYGGKKYDYHGNTYEFVGSNATGTRVYLQSVNDDQFLDIDMADFLLDGNDCAAEDDYIDDWRPGDAPWNAPGMSVSDFI